jgi:hypothetical protein
MMQNKQKTSKRQIVIGRNSSIWSVLAQDKFLGSKPFLAIGHRELTKFKFEPEDRVWIFSYSRQHTNNLQLLQHLKDTGVTDIIYITSASTNIASITQCYAYPRIKLMAHEAAIKICQAKIVCIGLFYTDEEQLPCGETAVTSANELSMFMQEANWDTTDDVIRNVFHRSDRPFSNKLEEVLYITYGKIQPLCGNFPCLLRPFDLILRAIGMRWYGYLYLSNRLWFSTTSSSVQG